MVAADFSPVGVERMNEIADRRLTQRRSAFTAVVADATSRPRVPGDPGGAGDGGGGTTWC